VRLLINLALLVLVVILLFSDPQFEVEATQWFKSL
jgi:hypothetical protein